MRILFSLAVEWLADRLEQQPFYYEAQADTVIRGVSTQLADKYRKDWLYLLDWVDLSNLNGELPVRLILLGKAGDSLPADLQTGRKDCATAVFALNVKKTAVLEMIQDCFAWYHEWYDNLLNAIRTERSWFAILDEGHQVLKNPMILYDRSMKVMAFTRDDGTEDEIWKDTVSSGSARVENALQADELWKYVSKLDKNNKPFRHIGEGMSDPFYNCNVTVHGKRCGMVTVIEHHAPLTQGQLGLLQTFSDAISLRFQENDAQRLADDALNDRLLRDLLSGEIASRDRLNTRLIASQWKYGTCFRLMLFSSRLSFIHEVQWKQNLEDLYRCGLNGIGCTLPGERNAICFLLSAPSGEMRPATEEILKQYCTVHHMRCGVSEAYDDLLDTPRYHKQAEAALEHGRGDLVFYRDIRFQRLIQTLKAAEYPEDLVHPAIPMLEETDRNSGTEYLATVQKLLENGFRQTETARALGIHRTTLIYRMRRISELTGLDYEDVEEMAHVAISLMMTHS